ncbi:hypothetical protein L1887_50724 [Cichorium endivia]|nr:hypothetical protein L1887_50724 [Cichorium endivia]
MHPSRPSVFIGLSRTSVQLCHLERHGYRWSERMRGLALRLHTSLHPPLRRQHECLRSPAPRLCPSSRPERNLPTPPMLHPSPRRILTPSLEASTARSPKSRRSSKCPSCRPKSSCSTASSLPRAFCFTDLQAPARLLLREQWQLQQAPPTSPSTAPNSRPPFTERPNPSSETSSRRPGARVHASSSSTKSMLSLHAGEGGSGDGSNADGAGEVERRVVAQLLTLLDGMEDGGGEDSDDDHIDEEQQGGAASPSESGQKIASGVDKPPARVVILAATNRPNAIDPALRRYGRLDREIEIGVPDKHARQDILRTLVQPVPNNLTAEQVNDLAGRTHGFVGADLSALVREAGMRAVRRTFARQQSKSDQLDVQLQSMSLSQASPSAPAVQGHMDRVTAADLLAALSVVRPSAMREIFLEPPQSILVRHRRLCHALLGRLRRPVHQVGPSSSARTRRVADQTCCQLRTSRCLTAQRRPLIDALSSSRDGEQSGGDALNSRIIATLLNEMDGIEAMSDVIVVGATNRPQSLDPALLRPGRLDRLVYVGPPDHNARMQILRTRMAKMAVAEDAVDLDKLAQMTEGCSGAEVVSVCQEAGLLAMDEDINCDKIQQQHFESAASSVKRRITSLMIRQYETWRDTLVIEESLLISVRCDLLVDQHGAIRFFDLARNELAEDGNVEEDEGGRKEPPGCPRHRTRDLGAAVLPGPSGEGGLSSRTAAAAFRDKCSRNEPDEHLHEDEPGGPAERANDDSSTSVVECDDKGLGREDDPEHRDVEQELVRVTQLQQVSNVIRPHLGGDLGWEDEHAQHRDDQEKQADPQRDGDLYADGKLVEARVQEGTPCPAPQAADHPAAEDVEGPVKRKVETRQTTGQREEGQDDVRHGGEVELHLWMVATEVVGRVYTSHECRVAGGKRVVVLSERLLELVRIELQAIGCNPSWTRHGPKDLDEVDDAEDNDTGAHDDRQRQLVPTRPVDASTQKDDDRLLERVMQNERGHQDSRDALDQVSSDALGSDFGHDNRRVGQRGQAAIEENIRMLCTVDPAPGCPVGLAEACGCERLGWDGLALMIHHFKLDEREDGTGMEAFGTDHVEYDRETEKKVYQLTDGQQYSEGEARRPRKRRCPGRSRSPSRFELEWIVWGGGGWGSGDGIRTSMMKGKRGRGEEGGEERGRDTKLERVRREGARARSPPGLR